MRFLASIAAGNLEVRYREEKNVLGAVVDLNLVKRKIVEANLALARDDAGVPSINSHHRRKLKVSFADECGKVLEAIKPYDTLSESESESDSEVVRTEMVNESTKAMETPGVAQSVGGQKPKRRIRKFNNFFVEEFNRFMFEANQTPMRS